MERAVCRNALLGLFFIAVLLTLWSSQPIHAAGAGVDQVEWSINLNVSFTAAQTRQANWAQTNNALIGALTTRLQQHGTTLAARRAMRSDQGQNLSLSAQGKGSVAQLRQVLFDDLSPVGGLTGGPTTVTMTGAITAGEKIALALESNPATGYGWNLQQADPTAFKRTADAKPKSKTNVLGAPIQQNVTLQALRSGSATLTMAYRRSWDSETAATNNVTLRTTRLATLANLTSPLAPVAGRPADTSPMRAAKVARAATSLPTSFDWRAQSMVTAIRDQGNCGSCWAFGTVGAFESALLINGGLTADLSEQYLVSCNTSGWSCDGGWWAHDYHVDRIPPTQSQAGAVNEVAFPYTATDSTCVSSLAHPYRLNSWQYIGDDSSVPSAEAIKLAIYTHGPVSAAVCVGSGFQRYTSGVFATDESSSCGWGVINHAIVLVGWNDDENSWILRNSWGTGWGENGYMRIARGVSNVGYAANYVVFNTDPSCLNLTLSTNPGAGGTISVDPLPNCSGGYTAGTVVTLTATAADGHAFSSWSGDASGTANPTTVTMNANHSVTANFSITATGDAFEPDDTAAQASTIATDGTVQTHTIHVPGDVDWIKFAATSGTQYTLNTANLGTSADTVVSLYDTNGTTELAYDDDGGDGYGSLITWVAPATGTYYAAVSHYSSVRYGTGTNYDFTIRTTTSTGDAYEPDDSAAQARLITTDGVTQTHNIHVPNDNDWVKFAAVAGTQYTIRTGNLGTVVDTYLHLYDQNGTTELAHDDDSGGGYASRISWIAEVSGTYYVRVHDYYSTTFGPSTNYDLKIVASATLADAYEPDGSAASARSIATDGTPQTHNFHVAGDNDWVRFDATAGTQYNTRTLNLGAAADTYMRLIGTDGVTVLALDDDGGGGLASYIAWVAPATGAYYVRINHYSAGRYGSGTNYDLAVTSVAVTPDAYEPDNTAAQAKIIATDGAAQTHDFHAAGDNDWVRFDATAGTQYTIQTSNLGATSDTYLYLYDTNGTTILARNDDAGGSDASKIVWSAAANGTYYARVRHYGSSEYGATTNYDLSIVSRTGVAIPDSYEPDNTASAARQLPANGTLQTHNFHVAGDNDWVQFNATAGYVYTLETLNLGSTSDPYLYIYAPDGVTELAHDDDSAGHLAARLVWAAPSSATYFGRVRHYSSARYGATTDYDLRLTTSGPATGDAYEPDNSATEARLFTVNGAAQTHNWHAPGDADWLKFNAAAGTQYILETSSLGANADTVMTLYHTNGTSIITSDDDSGPGWGSRIVWTATTDGTYYVRIRNYTSARYGAGTNYNVTIQGTVARLASQKAAEIELRVETTKSVSVGGLVTANIYLTRAAATNLLTFQLQYKTDYLALVDQSNQTTNSLRSADVLRGVTTAVTVDKVAVASDQGRVQLAIKPGKLQSAGTAVLVASVTFRALQATPADGTPIAIDGASVADAGSTIATRVVSGKVSIVAATPKVTSFTPSTISNVSSQTVTITGSGFVDKPTVLFDDVVMADVVYVKEDTLQVLVPAGFKTGSFKVTVVNPDNVQESAAASLRVVGSDSLIYVPLVIK